MKNKRTVALGGKGPGAADWGNWAWLSFGNRPNFKIEETSIRSMMPLVFRSIYRGEAEVGVIYDRFGQEGENEE